MNLNLALQALLLAYDQGQLTAQDLTVEQCQELDRAFDEVRDFLNKDPRK